MINDSYQFTGNTGAIKPHNTLFRVAKAQKINTSIPRNFLINNRKFLMNIGFTN